ncbi:hypothetical protein CTA2_78 [Colletotrichum tanaceti]|uniref:Uncharacterized protein n=1 Tax=Colletotrichum tanaceti TaxID=1306861 RepID=A0A4U6XL38_9PEZI|nr:hypothetical protein CTA2_51 [Colletotrichum tanaceti]KAJ0169046.1 hypothetical protein CTA2_78 [Colletotrichum tanaceti]TKW56337.1 hypothetical protein CTA1_1798 [Colletotrichum tanaceti]
MTFAVRLCFLLNRLFTYNNHGVWSMFRPFVPLMERQHVEDPEVTRRWAPCTHELDVQIQPRIGLSLRMKDCDASGQQLMPFLTPFNMRRRSHFPGKILRHSRRQLGRFKHPYPNAWRWIFRENDNVEVALITAVNIRIVTEVHAQVCIYQAVTAICSFDPDARTML